MSGINDIFQALGDPTRREIIRLLRNGDKTAGEIADNFNLAKSTLSGHFKILKYSGLIVSEKQGTTIFYSINTSVYEEAIAAFLDLFGRNNNEVSKGEKK